MRSIFYFAAITLYYRLPVSGFYQETLLGKFLTRDRVPKKLFLFVPKFLCPPNFQICIFWDFQIWSNLNQTSLCVFPFCVFFTINFHHLLGGPVFSKLRNALPPGKSEEAWINRQTVLKGSRIWELSQDISSLKLEQAPENGWLEDTSLLLGGASW